MEANVNDSLFEFDEADWKALQAVKPWATKYVGYGTRSTNSRSPDYFQHVKISSLALMKMVERSTALFCRSLSLLLGQTCALRWTN